MTKIFEKYIFWTGLLMVFFVFLTKTMSVLAPVPAVFQDNFISNTEKIIKSSDLSENNFILAETSEDFLDKLNLQIENEPGLLPVITGIIKFIAIIGSAFVSTVASARYITRGDRRLYLYRNISVPYI